MKYLFVLLSIFFLGCTAPTLHYQHNTITLTNQYSTYIFQGKTIHIAQQNLSDISIKQYLFTDTFNENLVYEYARIKTGYRFKYTYRYILQQVFDARDVEQVRDEDGLGFFRITLKDKSKLNLIAVTGTKKSLTILYGFSDENFQAIIDNKVLNKQEPTVETDQIIKSRWNVKLIITGVLLEQEKARPYYR